MSTLTTDQLLAGAQSVHFFDKAVTPTLTAGRSHSLWYQGGIPSAGTSDTSTSGGVALSSSSALVNGQIPHYDPSAGVISNLDRFAANATQSGVLELVDRLWECGWNNATSAAFSPTSVSAQTITTSATWPARDANGATAGVSVFIALEVMTALAAGTPTYTLTYTNSAGTGSETATNIFATAASAEIGAFYQFGSTAGDVGVKSVQDIQASATQTSGQWVLVAYRILDVLEMQGNYVGNEHNAFTSGFPQIFNGTVPFLVFTPNTTTATYISGSYTEVQN